MSVKAPELIKGGLVAVFLAFFFYRSVFAFWPMLAPAAVWVWWERKKAEQEKDSVLLQQFGECILSVSSCVRSGYAAENGFLESIKDMEMMYGKDAPILKELQMVKGGLASQIPLEKLLENMGQRTRLKEIQEFAEVFAIAKRSGANISEVIKMTADHIATERYLKLEIKTALASKRLEQRIMNFIPFFLVWYVEITTPGYFDEFFGNFEGIVIMSCFLLWYMVAYVLSEYILWKLKRE